MDNYPIDWQLLGNALHFFQKNGYRYVEVPWVVHESIVQLTLPEGASPFKVENVGSLIGSAEQGFLSLRIENKLEAGKYVSCSPCFRNEPHLDKYHQTQFMKVELYDDKNVSEDTKWDMMENVEDFLAEYSEINLSNLKLSHSKNETDIELNGIEIGSYGIRTIKDHSWVYGTGLALPRLSLAIDRKIF